MAFTGGIAFAGGKGGAPFFYRNCSRSRSTVLSCKILFACLAWVIFGCGGSSYNPPPPQPPVNNPVPAVTSISPSSGTAGGAAFTLTVNGSNFISSSAVNWNGSSRATTYVSATQLTASITATDIATAGTGNVTVVNPTPGGGMSQTMSFTINSNNSSCNMPPPLNPPISATACSTSSGHTCLDATFGNAAQVPPGGLVLTNTGSAVAIKQQQQAAGTLRYIAMGDTTNPTGKGVIVRYNLDGSLDTSFGSAGILQFLGPSGGSIGINDGTVDSAGNILAVDSTHLVRFTPTGVLDSTFGSAGYVTLSGLTGVSLRLQPDGKIVVVGQGSDKSGNPIGAVFRYNTDGSLDTTFGSNGGVVIPGSLNVGALAIQVLGSEQYILAGGHPLSKSFFVTRLTSTGSIDSTFGASGIAATTFCGDGGLVTGLSVDPVGNILAGGTSSLGTGGHVDYVLARFASNGSLDTTFGDASTPGRTVLDFFGADNGLTSIQPVLDNGGNEIAFVVGGAVKQSPSSSYLAVAKYQPNGTLDPTFGTNGGVAIDFGSKSNSQMGGGIGSILLVQADGKIVITGTANFGSGPYTGYNFALARLWP